MGGSGYEERSAEHRDYHYSPFDGFMRDGLASICLVETLFDLGQEQKSFHGVFIGGILGKALR
jgi:hypothetical protein